MHTPLPTTLIILLGLLITKTLGSASLTPPEPTFTIQTSTGTSSTTGTAAGTSSGTGTTTRTATGTGTTTGTTTGISSTNSTTSTATTASTAEFPSLSGVSSCVSDCLASAISRVGCSSVVDVNCFCTNSRFTPELVACVLANCADEISTSENLAQQFCNVASASPSLSFPPVPTTTSETSTSTTDTTTAPPTSSPTPSPTSAAISTIAQTSHETMLGLLITTFGLIFGAYVVQ